MFVWSRELPVKFIYTALPCYCLLKMFYCWRLSENLEKQIFHCILRTESQLKDSEMKPNFPFPMSCQEVFHFPMEKKVKASCCGLFLALVGQRPLFFTSQECRAVSPVGPSFGKTNLILHRESLWGISWSLPAETNKQKTQRSLSLKQMQKHFQCRASHGPHDTGATEGDQLAESPPDSLLEEVYHNLWLKHVGLGDIPSQNHDGRVACF